MVPVVASSAIGGDSVVTPDPRVITQTRTRFSDFQARLLARVKTFWPHFNVTHVSIAVPLDDMNQSQKISNCIQISDGANFDCACSIIAPSNVPGFVLYFYRLCRVADGPTQGEQQPKRFRP